MGFGSIRVQFDLETEATREQLDTLLRLTERYCVVLQTLRTSPSVEYGAQGTSTCSGWVVTTTVPVFGSHRPTHTSYGPGASGPSCAS